MLAATHLFVRRLGAQVIGCYLGGTTLGLLCCLGVGSSIIHFQPESIPAERFIGKTPEYIEVYTATYKQETIRLRLESAIFGGAITGCVALGGLGSLINSLTSR